MHFLGKAVLKERRSKATEKLLLFMRFDFRG